MKKKIFIIGGIFVVFIVWVMVTLFAAEHYTGKADFCGTTCHTMKPPYETWKKDLHSKNDVACVDCHYAPGERPTLKGKFRGLGQLFS